MSIIASARHGLRFPRASHGLVHVCISVAILCAWSLPRGSNETLPGRGRSAGSAVSEAELDAALQRAAEGALRGREGTVVVMEAQTGRLRAVVNPRFAFAEALPPGSTIKPFTTLAALRAGLIDDQSRTLCHGHYMHGDFATSCSHPRLKPPFNVVQALAYSCNYFFSKLGERLNEKTFDASLSSFGFGAQTGAGGPVEAQGNLPRGAWRVESALGEGGQLLVTPVQLIAAYAALINGGHLLVPQQAPAQDFVAREHSRLRIAPAHRALLIEGMRGAIAYGTAARAGLGTLSPYIFGKTGTSTPDDDFRTHGWFVGFAAEANSVEQASPESVRLVVLVFLKHAHGAECAELARPVFEEYARRSEETRAVAAQAAKNVENEPGGESASVAGRTEGAGDSTASPGSAVETGVARTSSAAPLVRVYLAREGATQTRSLDDYVFGVLAAESSVEDELEALKAQAVISRTFALKNLRRHGRDGHDFCTSTHCQRYVSVRDESARADFYRLLRRALDETSDEVLRDPQGRPAEAYFSAACGGATADIRALWGVTAHAPPYLRGVPDSYCAGTPYSSWRDAIPSAELIRALSADERTDVGARLDRIRIIRRDQTGRAELLSLEGERRRFVRGWDFKIVVGRTLGWSVLKSTRFEVARSGTNFVLRGSGFGHGLGLCQTGAHVMARRGASYRQILRQYFPGTTVSGSTPAESVSRVGKIEVENIEMESRPDTSEGAAAPRPVVFRSAVFNAQALDMSQPPQAFLTAHVWAARTRRNATPARLALSSEHFHASYPARLQRREVELALATLEAARAGMLRRLSAAALNPGELPTLTLFIHDTTGDFVAATGQPAWVSGAARRDRIETQPLDVLRRRGVLPTTLRHEYAHTVIEALGRGRAPRWLAEGLAAYVAGEGAMLTRLEPKHTLPLDEIERRLAEPTSAQEMRTLYAAAYREVSALIRKEGEANVWRRVAPS